MNNETLTTEISRLTLKPGDVLVIRLKGWPKSHHAKRIEDEMRELLAKAGHLDTQVMILGPDVKLEILEHAA